MAAAQLITPYFYTHLRMDRRRGENKSELIDSARRVQDEWCEATGDNWPLSKANQFIIPIRQSARDSCGGLCGGQAAEEGPNVWGE